jgi:rhodanese-related sulfurtransferase
VAAVEELTPSAFAERWTGDGDGNVQLVDVREPVELAMASLPWANHIPMAQIPHRLAELDPARPIVVMCHSGQRSRYVAAYLLANGFEHVYNLRGGIDAWSTELDPELPRY